MHKLESPASLADATSNTNTLKEVIIDGNALLHSLKNIPETFGQLFILWQIRTMWNQSNVLSGWEEAPAKHNHCCCVDSQQKPQETGSPFYPMMKTREISSTYFCNCGRMINMQNNSKTGKSCLRQQNSAPVWRAAMEWQQNQPLCTRCVHLTKKRTIALYFIVFMQPKITVMRLSSTLRTQMSFYSCCTLPLKCQSHYSCRLEQGVIADSSTYLSWLRCMTKVLSVLFWGFMHLQGVTPLVHSFEEEKWSHWRSWKQNHSFCLHLRLLVWMTL